MATQLRSRYTVEVSELSPLVACRPAIVNLQKIARQLQMAEMKFRLILGIPLSEIFNQSKRRPKYNMDIRETKKFVEDSADGSKHFWS